MEFIVCMYYLRKVLNIEHYSFYSNEFALFSKHQTRNMAVVNNHVFVLLMWMILFTSHTHAQPEITSPTESMKNINLQGKKIALLAIPYKSIVKNYERRKIDQTKFVRTPSYYSIYFSEHHLFFAEWSVGTRCMWC